ncbi:DNA-binding transcription factor cat8 [Talaromyces marneffei ATCC 18224]|uniref:C6 transcription factor FacB/Cat8 n=1 Tax=Talaromyces marneffei (strain ATCC 18224 / CBS 334.59 / QM 7333) TaxID=441960 RepID=B6QCH0_TALMQ|nr:uncharacterized protein EYB26_002890 [Talaromyces marneffei]EEA25624.1 C6 transcription factor FacB/Cat8 [Talaromyces marneffei ATCC 18224]QGA15233.1 hypothetical protein EYB26_002890 [Talaromyces marneffei]
MPGILPMKVIKMGSNAQSRIAQACDRCRSKKIRCDGVRPCCTQCKNVGFECKTSDKLSRRAFPRGYTESLEDRVRALEAEVRDLKTLLDERDEKIEVLSRIHSFGTPRQKAQPNSTPSPASTSGAVSETSRSPLSEEAKPSPAETERVITVKYPTKSSGSSPFAGPSSVRAFSSTLTSKLEARGISSSSFSTKALTAFPPKTYQRKASSLQSLPRLVSDQLINIYFQEWAPLYPVVHRSTILKAYDRYLADPSLLKDQPLTIIQLNLIFGIAALSSMSRTNQDPKLFENNWYTPLESLSGEMSVPAIQCMVLAQMYFLTKGDYQSLLRYRALSVGTIQSLGLDQSQQDFVRDPLLHETRKKVFWCQYMLDRFTATMTGLPVMLRDDRIGTEMPADIDDENITEDGLLPGLPDECTRMSSALALIEASRILGKALEILYPSAANAQVSVTKLHGLSEELDTWNKGLPTHLKLIFIQDRPSTNVTSSRSPLLSLVYYFIRILIHRPAACFGTADIMNPALLTISDSSKHIIQILQLLDERRLSLSLAINRLEVAYLSGLGILWQDMTLERGNKLVQESRNLLLDVKVQLEPESNTAATEFRILSNLITGADSQRSMKIKKALQTSQSRADVGAEPKSAKDGVQSRRNTISNLSAPHRSPQQMRQQPGAMDPPRTMSRPKSFDISSGVNVDYYPLNADSLRSVSTTDVSKMALSAAEWEGILSDLDHGNLNIFTGIYGGQECADQPSSNVPIDNSYSPHQSTSAYAPIMQQHVRLSPQDTSSEAWSACSSGDVSYVHDGVRSYPAENTMNTDDGLPFKDFDLTQSLQMVDAVKGIMIPSAEEDFVDLGIFDGWDRSLMA